CSPGYPGDEPLEPRPIFRRSPARRRRPQQTARPVPRIRAVSASLLSSRDPCATTLFVEPDVFHAPAVIDAIGHQCQALDPGLPAGGSGRVIEHRANTRLGEDALDLPYDLFALYRVGLHRLLVNQLVELGVAVPGVVPYRAAHVVFVE